MELGLDAKDGRAGSPGLRLQDQKMNRVLGLEHITLENRISLFALTGFFDLRTTWLKLHGSSVTEELPHHPSPRENGRANRSEVDHSSSLPKYVHIRPQLFKGWIALSHS